MDSGLIDFLVSSSLRYNPDMFRESLFIYTVS